MKERKGTQARKGSVKKVGIPEDAKAKLETYAKSKGIPMSAIMATFIDQGVEHDIYEGNWIDKVQVMKERMNAFSFLDGGCAGLCYGEDEDDKGIYSCVWYRQGRPPQIRILGKTESLANSRCQGCNKTEEIWKGIASYEDEIKHLKERVAAGISVAVPRCMLGSLLSEDGTRFRCTRQMIDIKVKDCKILRKGAPCKDLAWSYLTMEGALTDGEKQV